MPITELPSVREENRNIRDEWLHNLESDEKGVEDDGESYGEMGCCGPMWQRIAPWLNRVAILYWPLPQADHTFHNDWLCPREFLSTLQKT
jgi:hypothetical protein